MFNLEDAYSNITLDDIYSKLSEYELWLRYCPNFKDFELPFLSEFYRDNNPDCRLFRTNNNQIKYIDFGNNRECLNIIQYIQKKYSCNFKECLTIISTDFNLHKSNIIVNKETRLLNFEESIPRVKTRIDILSQPFNLTDFNYWNRYKIPLSLLSEYNVFSCKYVYLIKQNKVTTFTYNKDNPIYAYRFTHEGEYYYKILFPNGDKKFKWLYNGSNLILEGHDQLSLNGNILILGKSLKDCMCYRLLGYDAISLQGEANKLDSEVADKLLRRFDKIIVNYDSDDEGLRGSKRLNEQYGFKYFFIDNHKDLSDYIMNEGLDKAKEMIKMKIEEIENE